MTEESHKGMLKITWYAVARILLLLLCVTPWPQGCGFRSRSKLPTDRRSNSLVLLYLPPPWPRYLRVPR